ncbi:hypothetical protein [Pseudomonas gingeri]|uniref:Uncharacterized protein n=1 Tax=Pseudomonas gingeri TaxID=117681 RepID=A0A7Y7WHY5_9PSED|nr:hypothetical protein [Pseudomonas gingeri]NWB48789.1 hypothetical protein [Pseudomonas gingeri]
MNNQTCNTVGALPACPKKVTELFYLTHPKAPKALLGPFLTEGDAECGRIVMRSADAVVTSALVDHLDDFTRWHSENNGQVCRAFAGSASHG